MKRIEYIQSKKTNHQKTHILFISKLYCINIELKTRRGIYNRITFMVDMIVIGE